MNWLRDWWWRRKPRCGAEPPHRLIDAGPCICPAGHGAWQPGGRPSHADGNGYVWDDQRWAWHGPRIDLSDAATRIDPDDWPKFQERP